MIFLIELGELQSAENVVRSQHLMKASTKLRLFGAFVILFNLWLIGHYEIEGPLVLLLTFGFVRHQLAATKEGHGLALQEI